MRIVFFGTPHFASTILSYLIGKKCNIIAVVTKPDKPQGRSSQLIAPPVKKLAEAHNIPVYQPRRASSEDFAAFLQTLDADLFLVAAYSEILKENLLSMPRLGCINVHGSILPKYRGAAPVQRCIMAGEKESGVTIMKMAAKLDAGAIYSIAKTPITEEMTALDLLEKLAHIGAEALFDVLCKLEKGALTPIEQKHSETTYAHKLTQEDGKIDWNNGCKQIFDQIRGVTPKPGAWCSIELRGQPKRLRIKKVKKDLALHGSPGQILPHEGLAVACGQGALHLLEVQVEGKKSLPIKDFLRGINIHEITFRA